VGVRAGTRARLVSVPRVLQLVQAQGRAAAAELRREAVGLHHYAVEDAPYLLKVLAAPAPTTQRVQRWQAQQLADAEAEPRVLQLVVKA